MYLSNKNTDKHNDLLSSLHDAVTALISSKVGRSISFSTVAHGPFKIPKGFPENPATDASVSASTWPDTFQTAHVHSTKRKCCFLTFSMPPAIWGYSPSDGNRNQTQPLLPEGPTRLSSARMHDQAGSAGHPLSQSGSGSAVGEYSPHEASTVTRDHAFRC